MSGEAIKPGTPLPWKLVRYGDGDSLVICEDEAGNFRIAFMAVPGARDIAARKLSWRNIKANAAYIVFACNEYPALKAKADALAEALKSCPIIGRTEDPGDFQSRQDRWLDTTYRQALAAYRESGQ